MLTLYGIKNCDTVKKARLWLDSKGISYRFHDFKSDGLTAAQLEHFMQQCDWEALLNRRGTSWRQLPDAQKNDITKTSALQLMLSVPTLIKRPVLDTGNKLLIGFNAEQYQTEL